MFLSAAKDIKGLRKLIGVSGKIIKITVNRGTYVRFELCVYTLG